MQQFLFDTKENILPFDGKAILYPAYFSAVDSDHYLKLLQHEITWRQEPIKIFGKEIMQPRLTAWYGDTGKGYSYSGIRMVPLPWTTSLMEIKVTIEKSAGVNFTSALLNYYRNGKDSMGWHRDNEKELGTNPVIASVSFGASRKFQFRNYKEKTMIRSIDLTHGSLLLMKEQTQHYWEHRLPKIHKEAGARINLTFRVIL